MGPKDNRKVEEGVHNLINAIRRTACNERDAVKGKKESRGSKRTYIRKIA